ncbi:chemotaxis protein [Bordetella genomosp. 9]|uniref:Chemotaxis protein n=1 Tax=Bordetella genomosp. 9 TaxID=1416803 RepID=A0A261RH25_9BORD|nr:PAS domain-containing methyl-accepting chemotaxis protein [Bordetella genomosp. 9]OZI23972.1 chemotaxis protein [Bordetella genomosp. 9]
MRLNLPVTENEFPFPTGHTLVSKTDTKGRIVYCNAMFAEVSGYAKEELLGKPHNIIRHPDMPEEAFRDMWATIASGRPWSAAVKNRRKNGDYYWVMANATPLMEDGVPVGYMSVRTEASEAQIEDAEALYATMRQEAKAGRRLHALSKGRPVRRNLRGRLGTALQLGLAGQLMLFFIAVLAAFLAIDRFLPSDSAIVHTAAWLLRLALLAVTWHFLRTRLVAPLNDVVLAANRLAAGDLTQSAAPTRDDEVGGLQAALGQLRINVGSIVRDARDQSRDIVARAVELTRGNLHLSERTEAQAGNVQQTAASMEEITTTVSLAAAASNDVSRLSAGTRLIARQGTEAVDQVSATMRSIAESSDRINEITRIIDSIAFQTNILALNASVEAARAGEQGRGFAVVAGEVRALAQRSGHAAKEIRHLIEDSALKVVEGNARTAAARKTMSEVLNGVEEVNTLVEGISSAANEQLNGISQANAAIGELDGITRQNASLVEQVAAAAVSLERLARDTDETMRLFRMEGVSKQAGPAAGRDEAGHAGLSLSQA